MPKLEDYREIHSFNTGKVSDSVRTLAIAAIGIIWIFKKQTGDNYIIPIDLYWPLILIISAMALDFLQYFYGSVAWFLFYRKKEKQGQAEKKPIEEIEEEEIYLPTRRNWLSYFFFYCKVITLAFAYYFLIAFLLKQIKWS